MKVKLNMKKNKTVILEPYKVNSNIFFYFEIKLDSIIIIIYKINHLII